ncbi:MFS general substrate transporter [Laetiporus sulphureus 93-53]|uniref:MFS general substrate transporter n=1 Tax=Laetiporus sulphureus 93-53 TaxID=1314785 RepID=A0A165FQD0_9APHY|nr:MFS general substrate transporter [Laetiporus sulphureus 93-53]KZT09318.1 MFS general substrate transporter [Laetiporus sulphureus 93-53]
MNEEKPPSSFDATRKDADESQEVDLPALDEPPDGGLHAWMVVVATWLISFIGFGIATIWGVFQDAYEADESSPFHSISEFKLGFVGGCGMGFGFAIGPFSNILISKFGIRAPIIVGVLMIAVAFELASISTKYWQLLLSQGILFGIGISMSWIPAIALPSQWFKKRRSLASGIASSGTGISGVVLSPVCQAIINRTSPQWALRFLGFLALFVGGIGVLLVRQRTVAKKHVNYHFFDLSVFKIPGYGFYLAFCFLQFFGYVTPLFLIPSYCLAIGLTSSQASGVLSVATATNAIGRIIAGFLADQAGPVNVLIIMHLLTGLMCIFIWLFAESIGVMMVFAIFWGLFSGPYWPLSVPTTAKIVGMQKLGSAVAIQFLMNVIPPIFAVPIGSRIIADTAAMYGIGVDTGRAYRYLIVWCALVPIVAAALLLPVRLMFSKKLFVKV